MNRDRDDQACADLALTQRFLAGDERAVRELAKRLGCIPRMLHAINRRRGAPLGHHDLEDLGQMIAVTVLDKLPDFRAIAGIEAWVYRITHYHYLNAVRNDRRRSKREAELQAFSGAEGGDVRPGSGEDADVENVEHLEEVLSALEGDLAEIIRMKHYDGLSFTQIGKALDTSPNTVKARYYRGIELLQSKLHARLAVGGQS